MNGRPLPFKVQPNRNDQHVYMRFQISGGPNNIVIHTKKDFGLSYANELPPLGSGSRGLRVISETWSASRNQLTLEISGAEGRHYEMNVWNPGQVASVEGATLDKAGKLEIEMPKAEPETYVPHKVVVHF